MSTHSVPSRFERSGSTVRFDDAGAPVTVTVCTSRIARVELARRAGHGRSFLRQPAELGGLAIRSSRRRARAPVHARSPGRGGDESAAPDLPRCLGQLASERDGPGRNGTESSGDGRRRLHASFEFSGEQHFYGLGQGGRQLDRLGVTRQLWNTHIGHGPGSDMGVPLLVSNRGYGLFFDNTSDARLAVGRSDNGVRIAYTRKPGGWSGTSSSAGTCAESCARWPSYSAGRRCRRAGRSDSSSRPAISTTPRSCVGSRARFARSESRATASSISRRTARPRAGIEASGISSSSRRSGRIRPP